MEDDLLTLDLFAPPLARNRDPHTSKQAAEMADSLANTMRNACYQAIKRHGPMTGHEVAQRLGVGFDKVHKRLPELRDAGFLEWKHCDDDPKKYQTRLSPSRRPCVIWFLKS